MVETLSPSSITIGVADSPSRTSSGREKLDVSEHGSSLAARLTMLKLDSAKQGLAGDTSSQAQPGTSRPATSGGGGGEGEGGGGGGEIPLVQRSGWGQGQQQQGPSLMEQMMAEAGAAKEAQVQEQRKQQQRETKSTFAKGLKKGFLSGAGPAPSTARNRKKGGAGKGKTSKGGRSCSSSSTEGVPQSSSGVAPAAGGNDSMPVITGRTATSGGGGGLEFDVSAKLDSTKNGLVLPEVQAAMESSSSRPLGGGNAAAGEPRLYETCSTETFCRGYGCTGKNKPLADVEHDQIPVRHLCTPAQVDIPTKSK